MKSIEDIVSQFALVPAADGRRWSVETLAKGRLHLSRGPAGEYVIFMEGNKDTFGSIPVRTGIEHSSDITAMPTGRPLAALRISCPDRTHGNRVIAHIAYELDRRLGEAPDTENSDLIRGISWILPLLGDPESLLAVERQYGLVGECVFLLRLIGVATRLGVPVRVAVDRWKGASGSQRDFAGSGVAVEVKATAHTTRLHHFASIEQLNPQSPEEDVYLFSLGVRLDTSAPKKLPDFFAEIESALVNGPQPGNEGAVEEFRSKVRSYGYRESHEALYRTQPGFMPPHLLPTLYPERQLARLRLDSFRESKLPSMVVSVGYTLQVQGAGLTSTEADAVYERMLLVAPVR